MVQIEINIFTENKGTKESPELVLKFAVNTLQREDALPFEIQTMLIVEKLIDALIHNAFERGGFVPMAEGIIAESSVNNENYQRAAFTYSGPMTVRPMYRGTVLHGLNGEGLEEVMPEGDYMVKIIAVKRGKDDKPNG